MTAAHIEAAETIAAGDLVHIADAGGGTRRAYKADAATKEALRYRTALYEGSKMVKRGAIRSARQRIEILDPEILSEILT